MTAIKSKNVTLCENRFCNYLLIKKLRFASVEDGFEALRLEEIIPFYFRLYLPIICVCSMMWSSIAASSWALVAPAGKSSTASSA